jgi:hypothetical protein
MPVNSWDAHYSKAALTEQKQGYQQQNANNIRDTNNSACDAAPQMGC